MDIQPLCEPFYIVTDVNQTEEEAVELFTYEDALTICEQVQQDNPSKCIEIREF
jgi:hypothetical protein